MGLFGSKLRMPMRQMLAPDMEDTPAAYPGLATSGPAPTKPGMFGGKYGGPQLNKWQVIGATLQQMGDNRGQLGDLYDREDKRQRGAFDQQREEAMLAALQDSDAIPASIKPLVGMFGKEVAQGVIGQAFQKPQSVRPVVTTPGAEIPEFDAYGRPVIDEKTGMPRVLYRNQNFAPRNSRAPVRPSDPTSDNPDLEWEQ
jgi:hypothetical protein